MLFIVERILTRIELKNEKCHVVSWGSKFLLVRDSQQYYNLNLASGPDLLILPFQGSKMKYGRADSKKIILHAGIVGNVNQYQFWAISDIVDTDFEENIDNLMVDSDTEFEAITYDATALINNVEEGKTSKMPLLIENALQAVVHTDPLTSSVHHQTASNDQPGPSKSIANEGRDGEESIDFSLASM